MAYGHVTDAAAEPWLRTSHRRSRELDHNAGTAATALSAASTLTPVLVSWHHHDLVLARWRTDHLSLVMSLIENGESREPDDAHSRSRP
jgi:hypothetical protein